MRDKKTAIGTSMGAAVVVVMDLIGLAVGYAVSTFLAPPPGAATVTSTERSRETVVETTTVTAATQTPEERWEPDGMIGEMNRITGLSWQTEDSWSTGEMMIRTSTWRWRGAQTAGYPWALTPRPGRKTPI